MFERLDDLHHQVLVTTIRGVADITQIASVSFLVSIAPGYYRWRDAVYAWQRESPRCDSNTLYGM